MIVLAGFALRGAYPSRMSVEHFDEGVYASNLVASEANDFRYPFQHLYAPPFFPALIEWSMIFFGQTSFVAMLASLVFGSLTPLLSWHAGRRWFGAPAGLASAALAAFSDFHIIYSRTALTDALLCFCFLLAVYLTWEAYRRGQTIWAVAAGGATALAWWTKYTGWLPLAVGISGLIPWLIFHRLPNGTHRRTIVLWVIIAITAGALWSPWWHTLQQYGGYEVVSDNHSLYVHLDKWLSQLKQQAANHRYFSGWLSCGGVFLAAVMADLGLLLQVRDSTWNRSDNRRASRGIAVCMMAAHVAVGGVLIALSIWLGASAALAVAALLGMAAWIIPNLGTRALDDRHRHASLAAWLVAAWFFGTFVSTPAYHPYPRLTLPWLVAAWMGTGALLGAVAERLRRQWLPAESSEASARATPSKKPLLAGAIVGLATMAVSIAWSGNQVTARGVPAWQDRTNLEKASLEVVERARRFVREELHGDPQTMVMYVYGEPGIFFHVGRSEGVVAAPVVKLEFAAPSANRPNVPVFLVAGPPASTSEFFAEQWKLYGSRFQEVGLFHYQPSDLVVLDNLDGDTLARMAERPREEIRLYVLK